MVLVWTVLEIRWQETANICQVNRDPRRITRLLCWLCLRIAGFGHRACLIHLSLTRCVEQSSVRVGSRHCLVHLKVTHTLLHSLLIRLIYAWQRVLALLQIHSRAVLLKEVQRQNVRLRLV